MKKSSNRNYRRFRIGAATAKRLAKVGHPVVAIARNEEKLKHLCEEINFSGGNLDCCKTFQKQKSFPSW